MGDGWWLMAGGGWWPVVAVMVHTDMEENVSSWLCP